MVPEYTDQDRILVSQLKEGSKDAYQLLFNRYAPRIFAFAMSYLKRREDAEELLQELFLKIWEIRATLDDSKNIKTLLFKICINLIYDLIRRKNIEQAYLAFEGHKNTSTIELLRN